MATGSEGGRGKDKMTAGLLGVFLGALGVHHFYLGSTTAGILELVLFFCCCGTLGVVGFVEGILLLTMDDAKFNAKYNARAPQPMEFVFSNPA